MQRQLLALEEKRHIAAEDAHDLHALEVLPHLVRIGAVHHVPVAGGDDRHLHQAEILVQLVPGGGRARAARGDDGCRGLEREPVAAAVEVGVERAVEEGSDAAGRAAPVHGRAEHEAVVVPGDVQKFVDRVIEHALVLLDAGLACDAAGQGLVADPDDIGINAFRAQRVAHLAQRGEGAALRMRAAVDQKYFHNKLTPFCSCSQRENGGEISPLCSGGSRDPKHPRYPAGRSHTALRLQSRPARAQRSGGRLPPVIWFPRARWYRAARS